MPLHSFRRTVAMTAVAALTCSLAVATASVASAAIVATPPAYSADGAALSLAPIGSYETGIFDESAAEIVQAYGDRLFVVNAEAGSVDVLDYTDPEAMELLFSLSSDGVANSVAIREDGLGVIAMEAPTKTDAGHLLFFDANAADAAAAALGAVTVGALPDMVTFSPDGAYVVSANEGEPNDDFTIDPEGSISVVAVPATLTAPAQSDVQTADFHAFEADGALDADVRVFGPTVGDDYPVSRNLEPEYATVVGGTAYVTLQEANAIAVVDLASATVTSVEALGFKDHSVVGLDASDRDPRDAPTFNIDTYEGLYGMYMPDAISSYTAGDTTYLVTANEGDAREWGDYEEPVRVKDLEDDGYGPVCETAPVADYLEDEDLGRLSVTIENGFNSDAGCYDSLYAFGARSFSIWTTSGDLVWDSGTSFEEVTYAAAPDFFNSNHSESNLEGRSEDKGPEAESVTIGELSGRTYAFVGFERVGGIAAYDITDPAASTFVTYINNRNFAESVEDGGDLANAGDLGPEGIAFIPAAESTTGTPLLAVGNEVSGTTTLFEITDMLAPTTTEVTVLTINDFHGRIEQNLYGGEAGAAVLAGAVDSFEAENPNTLFVSAGDNIGASTFTSNVAQDTPTIDALVAAGLDLGAVGNHEFDQGYLDITDRVLPRFGSTAQGLGANVYDRATGDAALDEYAIETIDGVRVAFIGTVTEDTANIVSPTGIATIEFGDQLEAANRVADELAEGDMADVIVLLTHSGSATSECSAVASDASKYGELIREASPDIDAIVSGHTHQTYTCEVADTEGNDRPVIQAHQYGTTLGKLDFTVDNDTKELISIDTELVPLVVGGAAAYPADETVAAIVAEAKADADVLGNVESGTISADILRGGTPSGSDRGVESTLGNTVADVYLWATSNDDYAGTPAEISIMNPGGLRDDLLYGEDGTLTYRQIANVQPFANTLVTVTLTGAQLEQILEEQWQPGAERPKLHLGISEGFSYEYVEDAAAGEHIVSMTLDGAAIAADDEFTVVTNSFLAGGGDSFFTFAEGTDRTDTGQVDLQATIAYFEEFEVVDPAPLGRAVPAGSTDPVDPTDPIDPTDPGDGDGDISGTDWATIDIGSGSVEQGGSLPVDISGLEAGQQIGATLYSDPIVIEGIPAAGTDGTVSFVVSIPADLELGAHTLVIESDGFDDIEVAVTVVAPGALAVTGSQLPLGIALFAALMLAFGAIALMARRRPVA
ncbi:choice-of-anchor I family protein [Microbacterium sp. NPDC076911]|uniref:choice-of-anchor I family protein n=1 Tax=Microbacterium sp. NPDC076911 TaxID=3154958 RepID=UPI00344836E1